MSRLAALLVLALALLQGTGLDARLGEIACADAHHETQGPATDCPPECATCPCCARVTYPPVALAEPVAEPLLDGAPGFDRGTDRLPAPPPRGILHVPRLTA